jgi:hypothetical protein
MYACIDGCVSRKMPVQLDRSHSHSVLTGVHVCIIGRHPDKINVNVKKIRGFVWVPRKVPSSPKMTITIFNKFQWYMLIISINRNEWLIPSENNGTRNMGTNRNVELGKSAALHIFFKI